MTNSDETPLEMGERHVAEGGVRIARQNEIVDEMDRDDHPAAAARGRRVLATMERTLRVLRQHLKILRGG
jgi:hypothetical protein